MTLIQLHRYKKPTRVIFVNLELISSIESYPETSSEKDIGSKIYFSQADIPVYINETVEEVINAINQQI